MEKDRMRENLGEIDFYEYLRVIWKRRWLIAIGVIVATLAAIPASYLVRIYESQGVLRLSEELKPEETAQKSEKESKVNIITLPEYKIYSAAFMDSRSFLHYLHDQKILSTEQKAYIDKKLRNEPVLEDYIKPLYAYAEQETKTFRPTEQFISAVQLSWKGSSPVLVQKVVDAMGLFVRDALEQKVLERYVTQGHQAAYARVQELGSKLADLKFSLKQNEKKLVDLKNIAQRSPEAEQLTGREVVSIEAGGHRYLPPSTQAVATEVTISDIKLGIRDTERQLKINRVKLEIFTRMKKALETGDAKSLFERLAGIKETFFQGKDLTRDENLLVRNEVFADFAQFEHWFHDVMQLVSGPTLPQKAKPSKRVVVAITFVFGLFFFTLLAFFLEFIQQGRQREKAGGKRVLKNQ